MRTVNTSIIKETVKNLFIEANYILPEDIKSSLNSCEKKEKNELAKNILSKLCDNYVAAERMNLPVCQDTGLAVIFIDIGQEVILEGEYLEDAVNEGIRLAYTEGYLRKSVVKDPLFERVNTNDNTPGIIHTRIVKGDRITLTASPKGFGSENMSAIKMFTPASSDEDIISFVRDTVKNSGGNPCPPIVVGVGIGGSFEMSAILAKKALIRPIDTNNSNEKYALLEQRMLDAVNATGVGPQGFGGDTTSLKVNIEYYPTHIAGLPVAVNIGCHVTRHKTAVI